MSIQPDKLFGIHAQALRYESERAVVLSNNLANVDTPNYKARDLKDFREVMNDVVSREGLSQTDDKHIGTVDDSSRSELMYRTPMNPSLDGNTVDGEGEKVRFAENSVHYEASLEFINNRISMLRSAIRGE